VYQRHDFLQVKERAERYLGRADVQCQKANAKLDSMPAYLRMPPDMAGAVAAITDSDPGGQNETTPQSP
jgi:hypothetical protein